MSINMEAVRKTIDLALSEEIPNLRERLDWADRDPTISEAMCFSDREGVHSTEGFSVDLIVRGECRLVHGEPNASTGGCSRAST